MDAGIRLIPKRKKDRNCHLSASRLVWGQWIPEVKARERCEEREREGKAASHL